MPCSAFAGALPALAALLRSSEAEQAASELLRLAHAGEESRRAVMAAGSLYALTALLSSPRFVVQQQAAAVVEALANDSLQVRESISGFGVLQPIIALLSSAQPVVQEHAAAALAALLKGSQQNKDSSITAYALLPLLKMLESKHSAAREHAVTALCHLSCGSEQNKEAIGTAIRTRDGLQSLLTGHCSQAMVILNIANSNGQGLDGTVAVANILSEIVQWLESAEPSVRQTAVQVLVFVPSWTGTDSIVAARVAPMLEAMLQSDDITVQEHAARVVLEFAAKGGKESNMALIAAGVPSALTRLVQSKDQEPARSAVLAFFGLAWLARLKYSAQWHDAMMAAGAFQVLVTMLKSGEHIAANTLSDLFEGETLQISHTVANQALPVLLGCLESQKPFVVDTASVVLRHLAYLKLFSPAIMSSLRAKHVC